VNIPGLEWKKLTGDQRVAIVERNRALRVTSDPEADAFRESVHGYHNQKRSAKAKRAKAAKAILALRELRKAQQCRSAQ